MDIKVGELVRTKNGIIDKIDSFEKDLRNVDCCCFQSGMIYTVELCNEIITKHSFNLIDLLEVKDIVVMLDTKFNTKDYIFIDDKEMLKAVKEDLKDRCKLLEVLTHEQFEANCYKIKQK